MEYTRELTRRVILAHNMTDVLAPPQKNSELISISVTVSFKHEVSGAGTVDNNATGVVVAIVVVVFTVEMIGVGGEEIEVATTGVGLVAAFGLSRGLRCFMDSTLGTAKGNLTSPSRFISNGRGKLSNPPNN